ncbi:ParD-like family protein [Sedimentimonas flavescens]|uniref:ParD-like family protein n=1 Tax=Sedimentimonas flavescens TaxID=2851012 RepID=UPI001C4A1060|nr:ParD-like family protein [Sedimentimonas flavescens]MBW0157618.1 ParD-like family protein [Sedimentimonas flavescens]
MAQSVKLPDDIMALVRREAELNSRSVAAQITHWIKIGRAAESSDSFNFARITAALEGRLDTTDLGEEECVWLDSFTKKMGEVSAVEHAFFTQRRSLGRGVGIDAAGNIVRAEVDPGA